MTTTTNIGQQARATLARDIAFARRQGSTTIGYADAGVSPAEAEVRNALASVLLGFRADDLDAMDTSNALGGVMEAFSTAARLAHTIANADDGEPGTAIEGLRTLLADLDKRVTDLLVEQTGAKGVGRYMVAAKSVTGALTFEEQSAEIATQRLAEAVEVTFARARDIIANILTSPDLSPPDRVAKLAALTAELGLRVEAAAKDPAVAYKAEGAPQGVDRYLPLLSKTPILTPNAPDPTSLRGIDRYIASARGGRMQEHRAG